MSPLVDEESVADTKKPACGGQAGQYREVGASTRCLDSRRGVGDCKGGAGGFVSRRHSSSRDFRIRHGDTFFEEHDLIAYISYLSGVVQSVS